MSKFSKTMKTLVKLGIFTGTVMYGINKFIEASALSRNMLQVEEGEYFKWSHGAVFFKKIGTGKPVLLLHDLDPASSGFEWHDIVNDLSKNCTVYIVDLPGCGRSSKVHGETYINYFYVRFLKEFIDEIIGEKTDVVATGFSGSFVVMASSIHEDIIDHITLINPVSPQLLSQQITVKSKLKKALIDCPILGTFLYYIDHSCEQLEFKFTEKAFFNPFVVTPKLIHTYYESSHLLKSNGRYLLSSLYGNYMNVNIDRAFSSLSNNITLIFGKQRATASSTAEEYTKLNPNAKCIFIAKTKMLPQIEAPHKLINYISK